MLCEYGCGDQAQYVLKSGKQICQKSWASCPVNREKNANALSDAYLSGSRESGSVVYQRMDESTKNNMAWSRGVQLISDDDLFCEHSPYTNETVRKHALNRSLLTYRCQSCKNNEWMGKPLNLDLDHINGVGNDHRLSNLRFMCPNCHSQTPTFRGRNINTGVLKVSDNDLIQAISECKNIRQVLIKVGLVPKGGNYTRVQEIMAKNGLKF